MKLVSIPKDKYDDYRLDVIFNGYKWDPQFLDNNTISRHILVMSEEEHNELRGYVEQLGRETTAAEQIINSNQKLAKSLALPRKIRKDIRNMNNYIPENHIRLMRFDFHPLTDGGWAISEVNSDVPGGFAESSIMPAIAAELFPDKRYETRSFAEVLIRTIAEKVPPARTLMLVHCTSYSDDRQVMQYIGDQLRDQGYHIIYGAADHLRFIDKQAVSIFDHNEGKIDGILRFTPLEWLIDIKPKHWQGYFDTITPSCNHPIAIYMQSKKIPLIWDTLENLGAQLSAWRKLLPETVAVKEARNKEGFIYKPVWGRVGEGITIKEACREDEYRKIMKDVRRHPDKYIAQRKFSSSPLISDEGETFHVCLGAYNVAGKAAGYYARISSTPRIDSNAADIPVLIERGSK